jgi:hypothetical protein
VRVLRAGFYVETGATLLLASLLTNCCHYPKGRVAHPAAVGTKASVLTIVAYGDTRTGLFGLDDNARQAIHGTVVDDIFKNDGAIDAVIFTGDAVMSNFFLWKKKYWQCFLSQSDRFRANGIEFYPSLGNHEVLPAIVPALRTTTAEASGFTPTPPQNRTEVDLENQLARAYELGEEPTTPAEVLQKSPVVEEVDISSKKGLATLKAWERGVNKKDILSANKFGQFERHLQSTFYSMPTDERCSSDANTFKSDYLDQANYDYLRPLLQGRSYYSKTLEKGAIRVKLIALDTNCLNSQNQQDFMASEIKAFDGPIVVFGHHPPVDYDKEGASWDLVPGWGKTQDEYMKRYLTLPEGKKIVLWIFGHVHNYQRRGPSGDDQPASVLLVAGGGASLDAAPAGLPVAARLVATALLQVRVQSSETVGLSHKHFRRGPRYREHLY